MIRILLVTVMVTKRILLRLGGERMGYDECFVKMVLQKGRKYHKMQTEDNG